METTPTIRAEDLVGGVYLNIDGDIYILAKRGFYRNKNFYSFDGDGITLFHSDGHLGVAIHNLTDWFVNIYNVSDEPKLVYTSGLYYNYVGKKFIVHSERGLLWTWIYYEDFSRKCNIIQYDHITNTITNTPIEVPIYQTCIRVMYLNTYVFATAIALVDDSVVVRINRTTSAIVDLEHFQREDYYYPITLDNIKLNTTVVISNCNYGTLRFND